MTTGRQEKKWLVVVAVVVTSMACVLLGFWQLDRAAQKRALRDLRDEQIRADPLDLSAVDLDRIGDVNALSYRSVVATGRWLNDREILIDNQVHGGRPGCHVLTPLLLEGHEAVVLVNRGWVAWGPDRSRLPETQTRSGTRTISGRITVPTAYFSLEDSPTAEVGEAWRRLWQNIDLDQYADVIEYNLVPFVIRMDRKNNDPVDPEAIDGDAPLTEDSSRIVNHVANRTFDYMIDNDDGYLRDWHEPDDLWIHRHMAYAVQWFGLAVTVVGFYFFARRRSRKNPGAPPTA